MLHWRNHKPAFSISLWLLLPLLRPLLHRKLAGRGWAAQRPPLLSPALRTMHRRGLCRSTVIRAAWQTPSLTKALPGMTGAWWVCCYSCMFWVACSYPSTAYTAHELDSTPLPLHNEYMGPTSGAVAVVLLILPMPPASPANPCSCACCTGWWKWPKRSVTCTPTT